MNVFWWKGRDSVGVMKNYEWFEPRLPAAEEIESFILHGADFGDTGEETFDPSW